jgi:ketosteroid isomerase-like protein
MSQENVDIVRSHLKPYDGVDIIPAIREYVERLGPTPDPDAVLAVWAEDESWRHFHPEGEWEVANSGVLDIKAVGPVEIARWWNDWAEAWDRYTYRVVEYRDLGEWVLAVIDLQARGRGGIPVETRTFEIRRVRDGKVAVCRVFSSEQEALEAAGLRE